MLQVASMDKWQLHLPPSVTQHVDTGISICLAMMNAAVCTLLLQRFLRQTKKLAHVIRLRFEQMKGLVLALLVVCSKCAAVALDCMQCCVRWWRPQQSIHPYRFKLQGESLQADTADESCYMQLSDTQDE